MFPEYPCYVSLTAFNILFKNKDDQFRTDIASRPNAESAGARESKRRGSEEIERQPEGRECGAVLESSSLRRRLDRGLDAIRDSRIASQDGFWDAP